MIASVGLLLGLNCILLREKKEAVEYLFQKNNKVGLIYINHRLPHKQRVNEVTMKSFICEGETSGLLCF